MTAARGGRINGGRFTGSWEAGGGEMSSAAAVSDADLPMAAD
jgi:hypothetical protein